ncbi:hypothetical protein CF54_17410 [Streptomyces sp. Tu 6176]|nr:hypothetical protein CF54_17410 [Streptomyces sp. Tu 6176]
MQHPPRTATATNRFPGRQGSHRQGSAGRRLDGAMRLGCAGGHAWPLPGKFGVPHRLGCQGDDDA